MNVAIRHDIRGLRPDTAALCICAQVLHSSMPQVVTIQDMRCITAIGVIKGSSWRVPTLEENHFRFGTAPQPGAAGGSGRGEDAAEEEAALELLLEALRVRDEATERQQAVRAVRPTVSVYLSDRLGFAHSTRYCPGRRQLTGLTRHC